MKKLILYFLIIFVFANGVVCFFVLKNNNANASAYLGTWWWNTRLEAETYLNFAKENKVNEIYYYTSKFDENTKDFISKANAKKIKVYWLSGEYEWLEDSSTLFQKIDKYLDYQNKYKNAQFSGIHLDIEPHQHSNFDAIRYQLIYNLIDLANTLKVRYPNIKFDYDLPFWLHDEITYNGEVKPAYAFMIDIANRIFVMSYRDTTEAVLNIAKEEISYAKQQNKQLALCLETYSTEGDSVSFKEEGKQKLNEVINELKSKMPKSFKIAVHHIKTWHDLI